MFRGEVGFFSTKMDRWEYLWNQNGILERVRSEQWTYFTYDALGHRQTKLGDATLRYSWNGNVPLREWQAVSAMRMVA